MLFYIIYLLSILYFLAPPVAHDSPYVKTISHSFSPPSPLAGIPFILFIVSANLSNSFPDWALKLRLSRNPNLFAVVLSIFCQCSASTVWAGRPSTMEKTFRIFLPTRSFLDALPSPPPPPPPAYSHQSQVPSLGPDPTDTPRATLSWSSCSSPQTCPGCPRPCP